MDSGSLVPLANDDAVIGHREALRIAREEFSLYAVMLSFLVPAVTAAAGNAAGGAVFLE